MANSCLIDTSAYSHFRRGHAVTIDLLAAAERVYVSAITLGELEAGFVLGRRTEENRVALRDFLAEPFVSVVAVDQGVAVRYGRLFAELRRNGTPIPINDVWIAACAMHSHAQLVTFDGDFERLSGLDLRLLAA